MDKKISVIVPIYKVERYLKQCVDSIIAQTYYNLEIILVDDGSPDNCGAICDEYVEKDPRIKVIHKENGGLSDARNAGLDIMTGEYVGFVDSDDWIEPDMYEKLLENMIRFNSDMSFGGVADELERDGVVITLKVSDYGSEPFAESSVNAMKRYFLGSWAAWDKLYRVSLFDTIRYPKGEINEDEAIVLHLLNQCQTVCYTSDICYHYMKRENSRSITGSEFSKKKLAWAKHCKANVLYIQAYYPKLVCYAVARYRDSLVWSLNNMLAKPTKYREEISQCRNELKQIIKNRNLYKGNVFKEKIRNFMLVYFTKLYAFIIVVLGKRYK